MNEFDPSSIQVRPFYENIRSCPALYLGQQFDSDGLHFLLLSVAEQTINPKYANENAYLQISILNSTTVIVADQGRGLPVDDYQIGNGVRGPKLQLVLTALWRNRFDDDYYQEFGYLDYLGAVLSATSAYLRVETIVDNMRYAISCSGGKVIEPLQSLGVAKDKGTRLIYSLDSALFEGAEPDENRILTGLERLSEQYPEAFFSFRDERTGIERTL